MKKTNRLLIVFSLALVGLASYAFSRLDEGMFPLSDLNRVDLKKAGLKIDQKDIFNPGHVGLVDALVQVGGCTGSFVSENGLIITNHHCAFSAVQLASTPEKDYLTNGFVARSHEQEIPAQGLTIRITDSYEDVSARVLQAGDATNDPAERVRLMTQAREKIAQEAETADPSIKAEVSEMFIGKSYVLFRYKTIEDVRLVYIPQRSIGEFGGETDNWMWPRHTGDFSFLRAYVAPDGTPAPYSTQNVPYQPKKHLQVNAKGVQEEDFAFILGYPGRTFRHRPAQYIEYQEKYLLPYISEFYDFQNQVMEKAGSQNKAVELKLATRIKRNANVMKNYRGKLKGLNNIDLVNTKEKDDQALAAFINDNPELKKTYGNLMSDIGAIYTDVFREAPRELWFSQLYRSVNLLGVALQINSFKAAMANSENATALYNANIQKLRDNLNRIYENYELAVDQAIFAKVIQDGQAMPADLRIQALQSFSGQNDLLSTSKLADPEYVMNQLISSPAALQAYSDALLTFQLALNTQYQTLNKSMEQREGRLNKLMGDYVTVKEMFQKRDFIPDANSTLRLTYGYIRGYSPVDAVYMSPFTSLKGVIEKGKSGLPEYELPAAIKQAWLAKDFGPYAMKELNDVPVNLLYNMDTTGGNSGSPIMDAKGQLIGVNFDRAYDATINDFAWNESYSRSIGVDIRYVLWIADKVDNADFILTEMGI